MVVTLYMAQKFGIFTNERISWYSGQGTNSWEDVIFYSFSNKFFRISSDHNKVNFYYLSLITII